jgi:two-component system, chemotaxis family, chemotaxis protein CheY
MSVIKQPVVCLLVDGDSDDQKIFLRALRDVAPGSFCYIATDGVEAMRILSYGQRLPDFIFLDIHTPRMSGKKLLEKIKASNALRDIPVVVHSTYPAPDEMEELFSLGISGIHMKEFNHDKVCDLLKEFLN